MKTISKFLISVVAISLFAVLSSDAQLIVKEKPVDPKTNPGKQPTKYMVLTPGEWAEVGGKYVYHPGSWMTPPMPKSIYTPGYWKKTPNGYYWISGYWLNPHSW